MPKKMTQAERKAGAAKVRKRAQETGVIRALSNPGSKKRSAKGTAALKKAAAKKGY